MACGVPVVSTDVGEARHILGDPVRVVESRDPQALAAAMTRILLLPSQSRSALGARDRDRVIVNFGIDLFGTSFSELWTEAIELHAICQ